MAITGLKALQQFVIREIFKDAPTGVMRSLPNQQLVDMNVQILAQRLMQNGIDPKTLKNANQVENAINMIESRPPVQQGIRSTGPAKIFDMEGQEIPKGSKIMGGKAVKETEEEILARIRRENKEAAERIRRKQKETMDDMKDIEDPEDMAEGGRIGLKDGPDMPGRRKFMKIMGGIASLPLVGKFVKPVMPLIQKGSEITGPALDKIVQTVMSAGKLISQSGRRVKEMVTKKKLKDVEVEEDIMDGPSYTIKTRDKTIYYKPGRQDEMGIEDDIIEVIEDTVTKKAGGGIARMLGE